MDATSELLECTTQQGHSEQPLQPMSQHALPGILRVNVHTDARSIQRRRRGFNGGGVLVLKTPPARTRRMWRWKSDRMCAA